MLIIIFKNKTKRYRYSKKKSEKKIQNLNQMTIWLENNKNRNKMDKSNNISMHKVIFQGPDHITTCGKRIIYRFPAEVFFCVGQIKSIECITCIVCVLVCGTDINFQAGYQISFVYLNGIYDQWQQLLLYHIVYVAVIPVIYKIHNAPLCSPLKSELRQKFAMSLRH